MANAQLGNDIPLRRRLALSAQRGYIDGSTVIASML
jgi:hypothetical protein